jgi:acyl carrier protein
MRGIKPREGVEVMGELMRQEQPQVGVLALNLRQWLQSYPMLAKIAFFTDNITAASSETPAQSRYMLKHLLSNEEADIETYLQTLVAATLCLKASQIDPYRPFTSLGFDSLMTLELRNRLENDLGERLSTALFWSYPTISALAEYLKKRFAPLSDSVPDIQVSIAKQGDEIKNGSLASILQEVEQLSDNDVRHLLKD